MEVKRRLINALGRFLTPIRDRRSEYERRPGLVDEVIEAGSRRARQEATETLRLAREAMGLTYYARSRSVEPAG